MPKKDPIQDAFNNLARLKLYTDEGKKELEKALSHSSGIIVAKACELAMDYQLTELGQQMADALAKWFNTSNSKDKGCRAKTALTQALCEFEFPAVELYRIGLTWVQKESGYGGPEDTAAELRGLSAVGLVRQYSPNILEDLADLLADPEPTARIWAARACFETGREEAAALVRLRAGCGEEHPAVILEIVKTLIALTGKRGVDFVQKHYLISPRAEFWPVAILALGESKDAEALKLLMELYSVTSRSAERVPLLESIAMTRHPEAFDFLLEQVKLEEAAVEVIEQFYGDEGSLKRLAEVLAD